MASTASAHSAGAVAAAVRLWSRRRAIPEGRALFSTTSGGPIIGNESDMSSRIETRARALSLYRQLLRGAQHMPTPNRRRFVVRKARAEFKANKHLTDPDEINFCLRLADTNLDTVLLQAEHLTRLMRDPNYHADV